MNNLPVYDYELNADATMLMLTSGGFNFILDGRTNVNLCGFENGWGIAIDAVSYPVNIVDGYYKDANGNMKKALGQTNTGRENQYNFVVVDRLRNDDYQVVFSPTGMYATLNTPDQYIDLKNQLTEAGHEHMPVALYVSGNGGAQKLTVAIKNIVNMSGIKDKLTMHVCLSTSVDGSRMHTLSMYAFNETGNIAMYGGEYQLKARHTRTIDERTVDFMPAITAIVDSWNTTIIPFMIGLNDCKFDRNQALDILGAVMDENKFAEKHRVELRKLYSSAGIRSNEEQDSLYRVNVALNQYISDNTTMAEDQKDRLRVGLSNSISKVFSRLKV